MRSGLSLRMGIGLVSGIVLGVAAHLTLGDSPALDGFVRHVTEPAGRIVLRLLFMLVIPLILSALALGVAGLGDLRRLGRIGLKTFAYTVVVSTIGDYIPDHWLARLVYYAVAGIAWGLPLFPLIRWMNREP